MEQLSSCITDRMIALDIINRDDKDCYCYSVQGILEKITCLSLIVICASIFQSLIEILAFLSIFMLIRRSSDGIHCKTTIGCFCASTMMSLSTVLVANAANCATCIGGGALFNGSFVHSGNVQQSGSESDGRRAESP